jgi:REP element-mobilizing transposase RayT
MSRPIRIEFPGALYHVTSRGNRRDMIFRDDVDRRWWMYLLGETCAIFRFTVYAYCQMGNHFHLLVRTREGKLARGMRYLNGEYSRHFNQRHGRVGHLFEGRYKAIICQDERYLFELSRYIVLNPVRAKLVSSPGQWEWSSFAAAMGGAAAPDWLDVAFLLERFDMDRRRARIQYQDFVLDGIGKSSPLARVRHGVVLGDVDAVRQLADQAPRGMLEDLAMTQRQLLVRPLAYYFDGSTDRARSMAAAYATLAYTMGDIARFCGVTTRTVSRAVKKYGRQSAP